MNGAALGRPAAKVRPSNAGTRTARAGKAAAGHPGPRAAETGPVGAGAAPSAAPSLESNAHRRPRCRR
jgi:hypothetical protein